MQEPLSPDQIFIRKLTDIVLSNLKNENFGVKELARELKMSHYRLGRKLFQAKGEKISQFIREVRLKKALEILQTEGTTASEVSFIVGFSSPAYFNKCFHEYFGYPPGKVTKVVAANNELNESDHSRNNLKIEKTGRRLFYFSLPVILISVLILGSVTFFIYNKSKKSNRPDKLLSPDGRISVAIMPFLNMTRDSVWDIWQDGIQQDLISYLSNWKELKVKQEETVMTLLKLEGITEYASISPKIAYGVSKKLDAAIFIYGNIQRAGPEIRLNAQIIGTKTREVLQSFEIEGPYKDDIIIHITDSLRDEITDYLLVSKLITENPVLNSYQRINAKSPEALKYYLYGYRAYYKADWETAKNWFLKALTVDSNYVDAMLRIYSSYSHLGMMEQALPMLIKLYDKKDQMPVIKQLYIKFLYADIFEPTEVRIKYLRQLQDIDDQGNYHYLIGAMYVRSKQFEKAVPEHEKYLEISRKRGKEFLKDNWVYPALGEVYHLTGQYEKEKRLYKEAWKVNDDHKSISFSWIIRDCGSLALTEGDTAAANKYIKEFISVRKELSSSDADILEGLGDMYWLAGKWDKGEEYYRKALSLEPENPERMNILANRLIDRSRNLSEVTELMNMALERASTKYDYYIYSDTKGFGLFKQGKYQEALDILQKTWDETPFKLFSIKSHLEEVKKAVAGQI
jgi:tetratricopeptide (TPR) repeat protein/AraC-like DNA-binding protein